MKAVFLLAGLGLGVLFALAWFNRLEVVPGSMGGVPHVYILNKWTGQAWSVTADKARLVVLIED